MKKYKFLAVAAIAAGLSSCVGDLNVTPIDPNIDLPEDILNTQEAYKQLLAKCYQGLCCSSSYGTSGDPDMQGVDGGYGQYMRAIVNLQEVTTDVCACCWNDGNLFDLHFLCWNPQNEFVLSMYYRIFYQVSQTSELIRRAKASNLTDTEFPDRNKYIAEARALRLLSYYHAIDMFANVPFTDENSSVGSTGGKQMARADLFDWIVNEGKDLLAGSDLAEVGHNEYGRCDKGMVEMILAKMYLNAEVWKGQNMYAECAEMCEKIISQYPLHMTPAGNQFTAYGELFCADNHLWTKNTNYNGDEIIFAAPQDGISCASYGSTTFLAFACAFSTMDPAYLGISSGWSGLSLTSQLTSKFSATDARATFFKGGIDSNTGEQVDYNQVIDVVRNAAGSSDGWKSMKWVNRGHDGSAAKLAGFSDIDFPVFRSADAYLMYAECAARGKADATKGKNYMNKVRQRAGEGEIELTLDNIIDERARELYLEGHRRQDLVRFGLFTSGDYLWDCKGGNGAGQAVDKKYNVFPILSGDLNANGNLEQNDGY